MSKRSLFFMGIYSIILTGLTLSSFIFLIKYVIHSLALLSSINIFTGFVLFGFLSILYLLTCLCWYTLQFFVEIIGRLDA